MNIPYYPPQKTGASFFASLYAALLTT